MQLDRQKITVGTEVEHQSLVFTVRAMDGNVLELAHPDGSFARLVHLSSVTLLPKSQECTPDEQRGVDWWNGLSEADRRVWCLAANTAIPAQAWAYYKQCAAE